MTQAECVILGVCDYVCQFFELSATPEQMKTNRDLEIDIHSFFLEPAEFLKRLR